MNDRNIHVMSNEGLIQPPRPRGDKVLKRFFCEHYNPTTVLPPLSPPPREPPSPPSVDDKCGRNETDITLIDAAQRKSNFKE
jgi:hypothetical protein